MAETKTTISKSKKSEVFESETLDTTPNLKKASPEARDQAVESIVVEMERVKTPEGEIILSAIPITGVGCLVERVIKTSTGISSSMVFAPGIEIREYPREGANFLKFAKCK